MMKVFGSKSVLLFLGILFILGSIFGGLYGFFKSKIRDENLKKVETTYTNVEEKKSILVIKDEHYISEYILAMKDSNITKINFPFIVIENNEKVYILNKTSQDLFKIAVKNTSNNRIKPKYAEYYIWTGFLKGYAPLGVE